jgi:rhamnose utilization protein RhaD (predicted bifunctional aldolase and dehydrogenase)
MNKRDALLDLCHALGEPHRELVLSAEGNVSMRLDDHTMAIKASGCALATMNDDDFVDVDIPTTLTLLDGESFDDRTKATYQASLRSQTSKIPSVEAILHAVLYEITPAQVISHTHPTAVNMLTCSSNAHLLVEGSLYPDAIVMLGRRQVLVPYTDPGVPLALAVREAVTTFMAEEGVAPKIIYLANHGLFVVSDSPRDALQLTEMAVKNARILHGSLAAGGPRFLHPQQVNRIDQRPDEAYRRNALNVD